jgi:hypothetical protein
MFEQQHDRELVLVLARAERGRQLAGRLVALEYRGARATDLVSALQAQAGAPTPIEIGLVGTDGPFEDLPETIKRLSEASVQGALRWIACGPAPDPHERATLRQAGVRYALFEPFTDEELRFVLNQARHEGEPESVRNEARVPADLRARIVAGTGEKVAFVYNLSVTGAYLVTPRPTLRGGSVKIHFALPGGDVAVDGQVVWNNVPGNLRRSNSPVGMGVRFLDPAPETRERLERYVNDRTRAYRL